MATVEQLADLTLSERGAEQTASYQRVLKKLSKMSPAQIDVIGRMANDKLRSLSPKKQLVAQQVIQATLDTDPREARGLGFGQSLANIANIAATIATVGLAVYKMRQDRKDSKAEQSRLDQRAAQEAATLQAHIKEQQATLSRLTEEQNKQLALKSAGAASPAIPQAQKTQDTAVYIGVGVAVLITAGLLFILKKK